MIQTKNGGCWGEPRFFLKFNILKMTLGSYNGEKGLEGGENVIKEINHKLC